MAVKRINDLKSIKYAGFSHNKAIQFSPSASLPLVNNKYRGVAPSVRNIIKLERAK